MTAGVDDRVTVIAEDYRQLTLPPIDGSTLFLGNPPYVRHHDIAPEWKAWYAATASSLRLRGSQLAGLHLHFLLKTKQLARTGDYGTFITAAEWLDVNYGETMRQLSLNGLGVLSIDLFPAELAVFDGAMTTAAVTCFDVGADSKGIVFGTGLASRGTIKIGCGRYVSSGVLSTNIKWGRFATTPVHADVATNEDAALVGDFFRVKRGQVTGLNSVWIAGEEAENLPDRWLRPTVTKARELIACAGILADARNLRRVVDLPVDLDSLGERERVSVQRFLDWAARQGADAGYVATHRAAWWSVGLYEPAPIVCTYMGRRPPMFVRNLCGARHINIAHGLYPRQPMAPALLDGIAAWLNSHVTRDLGRTYA
ncbi:MAG: Eco57I restriction-modification methylase domain-containing protein, partial [Gammaproteobacteria bacterium]